MTTLNLLRAGVFDEFVRKFPNATEAELAKLKSLESDPDGLKVKLAKAEVAVDELRAEGVPIGLLKPRVFRPFPHLKLAEALKNYYDNYRWTIWKREAVLSEHIMVYSRLALSMSA